MFTVPYAIFLFIVTCICSGCSQLVHDFPIQNLQVTPKSTWGQARMAFKGPKTMPEARCREAVAPIGLRWFISRMNTMVNKC